MYYVSASNGTNVVKVSIIYFNIKKFTNLNGKLNVP